MSRLLHTNGFWLVLILVTIAGVAYANAQEPLTEVEKLRQQNLALTSQVVDLQNKLNVAKVETGQCYTRLAPFEAQQNKVELQRQIEAFQAEVEKPRPGFSFDPYTLALTPKPSKE